MDTQWLDTAKTHIYASSIPWRHYRARAVAELKSRIEGHAGLPSKRPLRDWTPREKDELAKAVEGAVKSVDPSVFQAALEDVGHIVTGHFHKYVHKSLVGSAGGVDASGNPAKFVHSKVELAITEAEKSLCYLLGRWPGSRDVMKLAVNVELPGSFRSGSWHACLASAEIESGIFIF